MAKLELTGRNAWAATLEQVLDGITHQLSNRVALLAGVSEILSGDESVPPVLRALADEVPKLEETIRLLRLLTTPIDEVDEPVQLSRLIDDAVLLAQLHPSTKETTFHIVGADAAMPGFTRPTWFIHEVVSALVAVVVASDSATRGEIPVEVGEDGDWVEIRIGSDDAHNAVTLRVQTLLAARRGDVR